MSSYRFCFQDRRGRVIERHNIFCHDELEAMHIAKQFDSRHLIEIWDGSRRVARMKPGDPGPPVSDRHLNLRYWSGNA